MMVACLLPDKGSRHVIGRSLMPFGNPEGFPTRSDLMTKPTPASRSPHFASTPNESVDNANFFDLLYLF